MTHAYYQGGNMRFASKDGFLRFIAVLLAYGLLFAESHDISISHWAVFNGVRLAALLLLPYEFWAAIALAELVPLAHESMSCFAQNGPEWALFHAIPGSLVVMPAVYLCRRYIAQRGQPAATQVNYMLISALLISLLLTAWNFFTLSMTHLPPGFQMPSIQTLGARWIIGNYLGILTVCPMLIALYDFFHSASPYAIANRIIRSRFLIECIGMAMAIAIAFIVYKSHAQDHKQLAQTVMLVPVVILALRHGWRGASVGGFIASTCAVVMMPALYDQDTLEVEVLIAFVMTTMLLLGARITALSTRLDIEEEMRASQHGRLSHAVRQMHGVSLDTPPDDVMNALLAAADAVLERHARPKPWQVLSALARDYAYALHDAWSTARYYRAVHKHERL